MAAFPGKAENWMQQINRTPDKGTPWLFDEWFLMMAGPTKFPTKFPTKNLLAYSALGAAREVDEMPQLRQGRQLCFNPGQGHGHAHAFAEQDFISLLQG